MTAHTYDQSGFDSIDLELLRYPGSDFSDSLREGASTFGTQEVNLTPRFSTVVDNSRYVYAVQAIMTNAIGDVVLQGVTVKYSAAPMH